MFLEKYWELQNIMGTKSRQMPMMVVPEIQESVERKSI